MTLRAENITVRYAARVAIDDVTAAFAPGTVTALLGPNGAGKTTLLKALGGLVAPTTGRATLDGVDIASLPPRRRARLVAYLAQERTLAWPLRARRVAALGRRPHAGPLATLTPADEAAVDAALARVDAGRLADRPATALSGGERARVLLARALAVEADVLLADEPAGDLDPRHQIGVMEILKAEAARGACVVVALHDLALAARFADAAVLLHEGRVAASGAPADVLTAANLEAVYGVRPGPGGALDAGALTRA